MVDEPKQAPDEVSPEELAEQLLKIKVSDLVVQSAVGLIQLGFIRISGEQRDLDQARLAIDTLRALEPIVREQVSAEMADELQGAVTNMQLAFASAVSEKAEPGSPAEPEPEADSGEPAEAGSSDSGQ
ncbi:MAG: DUF1844 domain-containing protein [Gaiellaceae bacterium]